MLPFVPDRRTGRVADLSTCTSQSIAEICILTGRPVSEQRQSFENEPAGLRGIVLAWEPEPLEERPVRPLHQRLAALGPLGGFFDAVGGILGRLSYFVSRFVGESYRKDRIGRQAHHLYRPNNSMDKYTGFSASSARQYQRVADWGRNCLTLPLVEALENVCDVQGVPGCL